MADANTKPRRRKNKPVNMQKTFELVLRNYPDLPKRGWPYLPWMKAIDIDFKIFGFKPGDRVSWTPTTRPGRSRSRRITASWRCESSRTTILTVDRRRYNACGPLDAASEWNAGVSRMRLTAGATPPRPLLQTPRLTPPATFTTVTTARPVRRHVACRNSRMASDHQINAHRRRFTSAPLQHILDPRAFIGHDSDILKRIPTQHDQIRNSPAATTPSCPAY